MWLALADELQQNISEYLDTVIDLLFTDIGLAFTFLETARISSNPERQKRCVAHAAKAYNHISARAMRCEMPAKTREELNARLRDLKQQLVEFGA
jgi:hypothetical protein